MKTSFIAVCTLLAALIAAHPAFAQEKPKVRKEAKPKGGTVHAPSAAVKPGLVVKALPPKQPWVGCAVSVGSYERDVIRAYVRDRIDASKERKPNAVPPGLAKKLSDGGLPPDWRRRCIPGKPLPVEIQERCEPLPWELTVKLPPSPPGTLLLAANGTVFRLGYPTYEILDVFVVQ